MVLLMYHDDEANSSDYDDRIFDNQILVFLKKRKKKEMHGYSPSWLQFSFALDLSKEHECSLFMFINVQTISVNV